MEKFEQLMHKVLMHNDRYDVLFVNIFIDGLDIRATIILLHKPRTIDAAAPLAFMQAELLEVSQWRYFARNARNHKKFNDKSSTSISSPSPGVLGSSPIVEVKNNGKLKYKDKLQALMSQRRKMGQCMKCADKWRQDHKCLAHVLLHVMEELLEVMHMEVNDVESDGESGSDEDLLAFSLCATNGIQGNMTIRMHGKIQNKEVLILIDSGSLSTFVSSRIVKPTKVTHRGSTYNASHSS